MLSTMRRKPPPRHAAAGGPAMRRVLAEPDAARLLGGRMASYLGTWAYLIALAAYLYDQTGSTPWLILGLHTLASVPVVVRSPAYGALLVRLERSTARRTRELAVLERLAAAGTIAGVAAGKVTAALTEAGPAPTLPGGIRRRLSNGASARTPAPSS
jgi:hypothetical protein